MSVDQSDDAVASTVEEFIDPLSSLLSASDMSDMDELDAALLLEGSNFAIDSDEENEEDDAIIASAPPQATLAVGNVKANIATKPAVVPIVAPVRTATQTVSPTLHQHHVNSSAGMSSSSSLASASLSSVTSTLSSLWNSSKLPTNLGINSSSSSTAYSTTNSNTYPTSGIHAHNVNNKIPNSQQQQAINPPTTSNGILALLLSHIDSLLPGERIIMFLSHVKNVSDTSNPVPTNDVWCCAMTFYRILLFPYDTIESSSSSNNTSTSHVRGGEWTESDFQHSPRSRLIQMPLGTMDRVEKIEEEIDGKNPGSIGNANAGANGSSANWTLLLHGKDNNRYLRFTTSTVNDSIRAHQTLNTYAFPGRRNLGYLFAFESRRSDVLSATASSPCTERRYDFEKEFQDRLGLLSSSGDSYSSNYVKVENTNYALCNSYPKWIIVPKSFTNNSSNITLETRKILKRVAAFRSESRLPALSWARKAQNSAGIWRCSQPKVGIQGNRCSEDERFVQCMGEGVKIKTGVGSGLTMVERFHLTGGEESIESVENMLMNHSNMTVRILDMRSKTTAMGNRGTGYGYENTNNYPNTTLSFCNITNIHGVRDAYNKMSQHCLSTNVNDAQWGSLVEDTKWLYHIRLILQASWITAFHIHYHNLPVLIHCSHGWDRTSQVSAIAQLFLDPYYRTMTGFATLVEKDFMAFGHPFHTRAGHGEGKGERGTNASGHGGEGQVSQVFLQFLDSVYQIVRQFPNRFEFNLRYLLVISEHVYSCRFGTLLCDNERERELDASIRQRTHCLWDYLDSCREFLVNESYSHGGMDDQLLLLPPLPLLLRNVVLWGDRHLKWSPKPSWKGMSNDMATKYFYYNFDSDNYAGKEDTGDNEGVADGGILNGESSKSQKKDVMSMHCSTDEAVAELRKERLEKEEWKRLAQMREKEIARLKSNIVVVNNIDCA